MIEPRTLAREEVDRLARPQGRWSFGSRSPSRVILICVLWRLVVDGAGLIVDRNASLDRHLSTPNEWTIVTPFPRS